MKPVVLGALFVAAAFQANADPVATAPRAGQGVSGVEIQPRAAPNWMSQSEVTKAQTLWQRSAERLTGRLDVDFGTQINREMTRLADLSARDPQMISELALECVAEAGRI